MSVATIRFVSDLAGKERCRVDVVDMPRIVGGRQAVVHVRADGKTTVAEFQAELQRTCQEHDLVVRR